MKYLLVFLTCVMLASCSQTEKGAAIGGASGAVIGGIAGGDVGSAVVGGAVGAAAGALLGAASEPGRCYYRDRYGRRIVEDCPSDYNWRRHR